MQLTRASFLVSVLVVAALPAAAQNTWYVDVSSLPPGTGTISDPYTSIDYALQQTATVNGDVVVVAPGTYPENVLFLAKSVTVTSTGGPAVTVIDAGGAGSTVSFLVSDGELSGFTVTGGAGTLQGGVTVGGGVECVGGAPTLVDCVIEGNTAAHGGGLYALAADLTLSSTQILGNVAETAPGLQDGRGGGLYMEGGGFVQLTGNNLLRWNEAGRGGGIYSDSVSFELSASAVTENTGWGTDYASLPPGGGGILALNSVMSLQDSTVSSNTALGSYSWPPMGGGMLIDGGWARLVGTSVDSNTAGDPITPGRGGGLATQNMAQVQGYENGFHLNVAELGGGGIYGSVTFDHSTIAANKAQFGGGVLVSGGRVSLWECDIRDNVADSTSGTGHFGGGVYGPATLTACTIRNNRAYGSAAGVYGATLNDCEVRDNVASTPGEGVGTVVGGAESCTLTGCRISGNRALGDPTWRALGGGVAFSTLTACDLWDNVADSVVGTEYMEGGGAYASTLRRCRVFGNRVFGIGGGVSGGALVRCEVFDNQALLGGATAYADLDRCTVSGNQASIGGGAVYVDSYGPSSSVTNSILWSNGGEIEVGPGGSVTVTYSDVMGGWSGIGIIAADPLFWNPGTWDLHLNVGSPCIDQGDPSSRSDPDGSRADMGAHPYDPQYSGLMPAILKP